MKQVKQNLASGEVVALMDFGKNYKHFSQASVQSDYFGARQTTIHPVVLYHKNSTNELQHQSMIFLSEHLDHSAQFVRRVMMQLMPFIRTIVPNLMKITYCTDGSAQNYKNRYIFEYIARHQFDFGIPCEWEFHATSHGKGPHDGIGGSWKRTIAYASLKGFVLRTALAAYEYTKTNEMAIEPFYVTKEECIAETASKTAITVDGTRSFHHVSVVSTEVVGKKICTTLSFKATAISTDSLMVSYEIPLRKSDDSVIPMKKRLRRTME